MLGRGWLFKMILGWDLIYCFSLIYTPENYSNNSLLKMMIFHCHVSLQAGLYKPISDSSKSTVQQYVTIASSYSGSFYRFIYSNKHEFENRQCQESQILQRNQFCQTHPFHLSFNKGVHADAPYYNLKRLIVHSG